MSSKSLNPPPRGVSSLLAIMLPLIALSMRALWQIDRRTGLLVLPYLLWSLYATYLNAGFWWLNP